MRITPHTLYEPGEPEGTALKHWGCFAVVMFLWLCLAIGIAVLLR